MLRWKALPSVILDLDSVMAHMIHFKYAMFQCNNMELIILSSVLFIMPNANTRL